MTGDKLTMAAVVRLDRRPVARLLGVMAAAVEPVAALFRGAMELRTRCLDCDSATWRREDYLDIGVPVREEGGARDEEEEEEEEEERDHPEAGQCMRRVTRIDIERVQTRQRWINNLIMSFLAVTPTATIKWPALCVANCLKLNSDKSEMFRNLVTGKCSLLQYVQY